MAAQLSADEQRYEFPSPSLVSDHLQGLLAVGHDLSLECLQTAYPQGIFPWFDPGGEILWWSPDPRAVFLPAFFHCSRRLQRRLRSIDNLHWCVDKDFAATVDGCAAGPLRQGQPWLGEEMRNAYAVLHDAGCCHSFEARSKDGLLGAVLVIQFGAYVCGETMFSIHTNGSKIALYGLLQLMCKWPQALFDCQLSSPHLASLGAIELPRERFGARLQQATAAPGVELSTLRDCETTITLGLY